MQRSTRTGWVLFPITNTNYHLAGNGGLEGSKSMRLYLPALRIIAMQNRQKLSRLSNFKYCLHKLEQSVIEN